MSVKCIETIPREALVKISGADGDNGGDGDVDKDAFQKCQCQTGA